MHRLITDAPAGLQVDHINGDKLDNRKENLRVCTQHENRMNLAKPKRNSYKFKGVAFNTQYGKWSANISVNGRANYLGLYISEEDAAHAYDYYAKKYFGEFANLNFPNDNQELPERLTRSNSIGYKGVFKLRDSSKFYSKIGFNKKMYYLGSFNNPHDAARMYNFWALDLYGDRATLNKIKEELF